MLPQDPKPARPVGLGSPMRSVNALCNVLTQFTLHTSKPDGASAIFRSSCKLTLAPRSQRLACARTRTCYHDLLRMHCSFSSQRQVTSQLLLRARWWKLLCEWILPLLPSCTYSLQQHWSHSCVNRFWMYTPSLSASFSL